MALEWYTLSMNGHTSAYWNGANRYSMGYTFQTEFQYRIGPWCGDARVRSLWRVPCPLYPDMMQLGYCCPATYELPMLRYLELDPNGQAAQVA